MSLNITNAALAVLKSTTKEPNIVLEIEGYPNVFGAEIIRQIARIGEDAIIGDPDTDPGAFYIGGMMNLPSQDDAITMDETTTSIKQTLNVDKAEGSSISSLSVALMDDGTITEMITPGLELDDVLQRRCKVRFGFRSTSYPEDYITVFRGVVTEISADAGKIVLQLNHPDDKKRSNIYKQIESKITGAINSSQTTGITLAPFANILTRVLGPDGTYDPAFKSYVRIDDEVIEFTGITSGTLTGVTRGALNTTAAAHSADASVTTFYRLRENGVILALKLMASGVGDYYRSSVAISGTNVFGDTRVDNSIFFNGIDVNEEYGLTIGDYVSLSDSDVPANDFTLKQITDIVSIDEGDFIVIDGVTLADSTGVNANVAFRSQYDTLPDGLKMQNDEIDINEHLRWYQLFLSSVQYDFYLKDSIENAKEFIESEIYSPMAAYSLPRKARASMGYHIGPIPGSNIKVFNETNIKNPSKIKLKRSTSKQFFNEIIYKFDEDVLEEKFLTGYIAISATSKNRIPGGNRPLIIQSKGLRSVDLGETIAQTQALRRLKRYEFGAEMITFEALLEDSFGVEIGDIIVFDGTSLQLPDSKTGLKGIAPRFYEIQNKDFSLKTGDVKFDAVDTAFVGSARYGLISPASSIKTGLSNSQFIIQSSYSSRYGQSEYRKWSALVGANIRVRNSDYSTTGFGVLESASSNTITVSGLSFTPVAGMIMELAPYTGQPDQVKLVYVFMSDSSFGDGKDQYKQI